MRPLFCDCQCVQHLFGPHCACVFVPKHNNFWIVTLTTRMSLWAMNNSRKKIIEAQFGVDFKCANVNFALFVSHFLSASQLTVSCVRGSHQGHMDIFKTFSRSVGCELPKKSSKHIQNAHSSGPQKSSNFNVRTICQSARQHSHVKGQIHDHFQLATKSRPQMKLRPRPVRPSETKIKNIETIETN